MTATVGSMSTVNCCNDKYKNDFGKYLAMMDKNTNTLYYIDSDNNLKESQYIYKY